ncbi:MAG: SLC13 family permease [Flavobacteriaceae bacterium]
MEFHAIITILIVVAAIAAYAMEDRIPLEVTAIGTVAVLLLLFELIPLTDAAGRRMVTPESLLAGFANPALVTVMALLVIGQGLVRTGALDGIADIASTAKAGEKVTIAVLLAATAVVSAFLNNTPVVVLMLPVLGAIAAKARISPSKVMMPLSFITILGGMTTLVGSSTNLIVAGAAASLGGISMSFFEVTPLALILAAAGAVYVILIVPRLLPDRATLAQAVRGASPTRQFIAEIPVGPGHPLEGATSVAGMFPALKDMAVLMVQRGEHPILPPFDDLTVRAGDLVIVAATRAVLTDAMKGSAGIISASVDGNGGGENTFVLAEAMVAPGSRIIGHSIEHSGLYTRTGCVVLGIQRQSRMIRARINNIRMEAGDVLLIGGSNSQVGALRADRDLVLMEWSRTEIPATSRSQQALAVFLFVVITAASGLLPIVVSSVAGALAMILTGALNIRQASRAFDRRLYLLVGSSLAMAAPMEATGAAALIAREIVAGLDGASPMLVLSAVFLLIATMTNILSNNASAALFTPIALQLSAQTGIAAQVWLVTVILATNCSFATPIGYQTNLLVMAPGHYTFTDFLRAGAPLTLLLWLVFTFAAPWYYGL